MASVNIQKHLPDESQLLQQLSQGEPSAFEFIVREYGSYLLNVARQYVTNADDAHDVVQETYLNALNSVDKFRGEASLKSWLHRITINNALMRVRKDARMQQLMEDANVEDATNDAIDVNGKRIENIKSISATADEVHINAELHVAIKKQIMSLPMAYRNILLLRDVEGYSTVETAELLDISQASVKTGLHRARNKLKQQLENGGY